MFASWRCCGGLLVALVLVSPLRAEEALPDPRLPGPYPVGVTTLTLVDHSRTDAVTKQPRSLLTEIWYPATDDARDLPKNRMSDFLLRGGHSGLKMALQVGFRVKMDQIDEQFVNQAVRDARVRDGKFPLLIFSHGNGGVRYQSTFWCDHLASHGFIVMSADHTGNSAVTVVDDKLIMGRPDQRSVSAQDRPVDVSFLIDRMQRMNRGEDSRFAHRVDMENIGVAGHSFGGFTAGAVINSDPRVKAIVPMTPVFGDRSNFTTPVLVFVASEDATIGEKGNENARKFYRESKGPRYLVEVLDAGHFSFSDMFQFRPDFGDGIGSGKRITRAEEPLDYLPMKETYEIANSYSTAFLSVYLKDQQGYAAFLSKNQFPDWIQYEFDIPAPKEPQP